jgi:hypothetical protein
MTTPVDTCEVRVQRSHAVLPLDTPLGKVYLTILSAKRAYLTTGSGEPLTINGVQYKLNAYFNFASPQYPAVGTTPVPVWAKEYGGRLIERTPWNYKGEAYTQAAYEAVNKRIISVMCQFLTQSVDMLLLADKIELNNEIEGLDREEEQIIEKLRELRAKREELEAKERTL